MPPSRRPLIAGNWKMNGSLGDARRWARAAVEVAQQTTNEVAVFPAFPWLAEVGRIVGAPDGVVGLGAQTCHPEPYGAYTGSVSAAMLKEAGCRYVLCGHSERRALCGETDAVVADAVRAALDAGLVPVLCVGETLEQRRAHRARSVVMAQVDEGMRGVKGPKDPLVIAYEPVWAIGTGVTATPEEAAEAHGWVRAAVAGKDASRASGVRILYGGSVKPENIERLLAAADVDGALVGGASLDPEAFSRIARARPA